ncbi:hypothetical protein GGR50DRAFT_638666 [Xylaria sp. CBS 124048]|nr:hypothetical protein GGR50DRAFT_638666 [Xylaria sp. CBS 124048]
MGPSRSMGDPYGDERRGPSSRHDSYRSGDRDRGMPHRRDSRDFRDHRYSNDAGGGRNSLDSRYGFPKDVRRDNDLPRPRVDTSVNSSPAPKRPNAVIRSPSSAVRTLTDELHFERIPSAKSIATSITGNPPSCPTIPKTQDPTLQEVFQAAYKWGEKSNERTLLMIKKSKLEKEAGQWRSESVKLAAKAPAYPPYHGLADKFAPTDRMLEKQLKDVEEEYSRELEQLVTRFTTAGKASVVNDHDPVIANLEAKFENISQLASKQAEQIEALLKENAKTRETVTSMETTFNSMKSDHKQMKENYNALRTEHDALCSQILTWQESIQTMQANQLNIDTENKSLKQQLQNFRMTTEVKLGQTETQLQELNKRSSHAADSMKGAEKTLRERIADIETKLTLFPDYDDIKEKLDDLDLATFNEMCEAWVSEDYNLKTQYEEYSRRRRQNASLANEPQEVEFLKSEPARVSHSIKGVPFSTKAIEDIVNTKVAAVRESINHEIRDYCEKRDDMHGEMMDDALSQIRTLRENILQRQSEPEMRTRLHEERETTRAAAVEQTRELETRIRSLEVWQTTSSNLARQNQHSDLAARVAGLEARPVDRRVDRIDLDVGDLSRKFEALMGEVGQLVKREWVEIRMQELLSSVGMNALVGEIRELQRRLPSMELAIKTLDSQFQNLSTKQLAEHIVRLVAPSLEQRFSSLELRAVQLENKTSESEKAILLHTKRLREINDLLSKVIHSGKRPASPGNGDEPSKKRKLDVNGGHHSPSPPQLQLQQQPSPPQQQQQPSPSPRPQAQQQQPSNKDPNPSS